MRYLLAAVLALAGCATRPAELPAPSPAPTQQTALLEVWQTEVSEDLAIYKAIRPSLSGPASALNLYDSATQGLASLSGEPTAKDVDTFRGYVTKPDEKVLASLRAEKVALDKKTDDLERKVAAEKEARIRAEAARDQAAIQSRKDKAVSKLTTVGAAAAGVGIFALLFGSYLRISPLTAGIVIGAGLGIAAAAPWLVDLAELRYIIAILAGLLAMDLGWLVVTKTWYMIRREKHPSA